MVQTFAKTPDKSTLQVNLAGQYSKLATLTADTLALWCAKFDVLKTLFLFKLP